MERLAKLQRSFIFYPDPTPPRSASSYFPRGEDVTLTTEDGLALGAWWIPPLGAADRGMAVLYAPGNGGQREGRLHIYALLAERGFSVLAMDYRGYGGNPGSPSEEGLAADARAAADFIRRRGFGADRTIYCGESLGTSVVSRLANTDPPAGIVLRSPPTSLVDIARVHVGWLPIAGTLVDTFHVRSYLEDSDVPVSVIHGTADDIVPSEQSAQVAAGAGRLMEELVLPGAGHNDAVMFGPVVADVVARLADAVAHD